jgi:WD40 repeat protein
VFGLDNLMDLLFDSAMESINRNERIIQLLKRLKLDPDHPPADFTGVYKYALVEYGVGKPRPVLEIFRQDKIQELFREALERNTPSILLKNGEDFLADHPLQADLQAHNVDIRREFYAFAAVFIEVAKRTRTPAEILAEQKLESLHRQIGGLQERLNRLPTIEGMRTEMARLAAQDYPALPGAAIAPETFSAEQCKAFALAQQMRGWFETLGFRFESHEVWQDDYFEWIINIPVRRGRYDRILVRGIDGEAGLPDVQNLKDAVETHRTDEGWLVTARRISRAARDEVEKPENDALGCFTFDELLDQDADFSGYLTWLESEIEQRGIDQKYVPLACLKEEIDPNTRQGIGVSRYDDRDGWIDGYIDLWLDDPAKEHISVLGEFGTGKTWFALHYAWKALQRYREAQRRGLERPRVVPLRDYAKAVSVESLFSEFFFRKHEIPIPGYSAFEQLNRMGKLLLIFDGFDEMAARVDRQQMINNFWELAKVVVPGAKVILTCRTEHFPEAKEGRALLNAELQASTKDLTGETPQFEVLELEKFNDEQIRQVLSHQAQPATVEQIMGNPELLDLARRPVLTELILEALPDIEAGKPVDMSRVYLYAVRHKMERDIKAERTFTSMADKLYFMCELSWEMLSTDRMSINYREFPDRIRKLFGPAVEEEKDLDHWHYDMMGQTMLIRNAEGDYAPAHRSLLEFFVAYKFAAELGVLAPEFYVAMQLVRNQALLSNDVRDDFTWSSFFRFRTIETELGFISSIVETFKSESIENLCRTVGKQPFSRAVIELLIPLLEKSRKTEAKLIQIIKQTRGRQTGEVQYLGGNLANIALRLNKTIFEGHDLSESVIVGADFSDASLRSTNFRNAVLKKSDFLRICGVVTAVDFCISGRYIATGAGNGFIQLWDSKSSQKVSALSGHENWVDTVKFSPDSNFLASGSFDKTIRVWNIEMGRQVAILKGHSDSVISVCYNPKDKNILASGSFDKTIKIWSITDGKCLETLTDHSDWIYSISFSPDGSLIASSSRDKSIKIWDFQSKKCIKTLLGHESLVNCVVFSPISNLVASGSFDRTVRIWDTESGKCIKIFRGHFDSVVSIAFSPDGESIASAGRDKTIRVWNVSSGNCLQVLEGHTDDIRAIAFSPDGKFIGSGGGDQTLRLWDVQRSECLRILKGRINSINSLAFSPVENILVSGSDQSLKIWKIDTCKPLFTLRGHLNAITSVAFNIKGDRLLSGSDDKSIKLWDVTTGDCLNTFMGHEGKVWSVVFLDDDKMLASCGEDHSVRIWDINSGKCLRILNGHTNVVSTMAFDIENSLLASAGFDQKVRIWNIHTGECLRTLNGHENSILSVSFSQKMKILATCGCDQTIRLWNHKTGECLRVLEGHTNWISALAFSPNGNTLVSASDDTSIKIWDIEEGCCLKTLRGHTSRIFSIAFTNDGEMVASGSYDEMISVWELKTHRRIKSFSERPYENMNICGVEGLTNAEKATLMSLGAIES